MVIWKPGMTYDESIALIICAALGYYRGNKDRTATALQVSPRTLRYWVKNNPELQMFYKPRKKKKPVQASRRFDLIYPKK